jgi:hypothetical protein
MATHGLITCRRCARLLVGASVTEAMTLAGASAMNAGISAGLERSEIVTAVYSEMRAALIPGRYCPHTIERFWSKVARGAPDQCWPWKGGTDGRGYGKVFASDRHRKAHVVAYEIIVGPVPEGKVLCHSCDNPPCCNPGHLWPGTKRENSEDMWKKGRARPNGLDARGSRNSKAILTEVDIPRIRRLIKDGVSQTAIGNHYGVTVQAISRIKRGLGWQHVKEE